MSQPATPGAISAVVPLRPVRDLPGPPGLPFLGNLLINTLGADTEVIQVHLDKIFPAFLRRLLAPIPYWRYLRLPADREIDRHLQALHGAVQEFIRQARARLERDPRLRDNPNNLIEAMIVARDADESELEDRDVAGNVMTMLLAGEDTTANTLAWTLYLLQQNPEARRKVDETVRAAIGDAPLPRRYEPERWQSDGTAAQASSAAKRVALPFGAGPRICPGRYLALQEIKMVIAMLTGSFEIESVATADGADPKEHLAFTMAPLGLQLKLKRRERVIQSCYGPV